MEILNCTPTPVETKDLASIEGGIQTERSHLNPLGSSPTRKPCPKIHEAYGNQNTKIKCFKLRRRSQSPTHLPPRYCVLRCTNTTHMKGFVPLFVSRTILFNEMKGRSNFPKVGHFIHIPKLTAINPTSSTSFTWITTT